MPVNIRNSYKLRIRMNKYFLILLCSVLYLVGCESRKSANQFNENIKFAKQSDTLGVQIINDSHLFAYPVQIECIDSLVIVADECQNQNLHIFNEKGDFISSFAQIGRGPGEISSIDRFSVTPDNKVLVYDYSLMKLVVYDPFAYAKGDKTSFVEMVIDHSAIIPEEIAGFRISDIIAYNDKQQLVCGNNDVLRYGFLKDSTISINYNHYLNDLNIDNQEEVWSLFGAGVRLKIKPDFSKMVHTTIIGGIMQLFEISDAQEFHNYCNLYIYKPQYKLAKGAKPAWVTSNENTIYGFYDMAVDDSYIYTLLGQKETNGVEPDVISVFDWNGKPIKQYFTNQKLALICKNHRGNFYVLTSDSVSGVYNLGKLNRLNI